MDRGPSRRRIGGAALLGITAVAMVWEAGAGRAAEMPGQNSRVEILRFAGAPVKIVRGATASERGPARREIVGFGNGAARPVTILRGPGEPEATAPAASPPPLAPATIERITFAGSAPASVTIVRGIAAIGGLSLDTAFALPAALDFERIAGAVHGAESSYGTDPAMWRPDPDGPQGPMQVSAAAARDSGGGNRFDLEENRLLGRAYLARMFRRYGNWPDALAAYNWGPGNLDRWIAGGRDLRRLPLETTRYIGRVLREAGTAGSRIAGAEDGNFRPAIR